MKMPVNPIPAVSEALLDAAIECTFPASDPIAIDAAFEAARRREQGLEAPNKERA